MEMETLNELPMDTVSHGARDEQKKKKKRPLQFPQTHDEQGEDVLLKHALKPRGNTHKSQ